MRIYFLKFLKTAKLRQESNEVYLLLLLLIFVLEAIKELDLTPVLEAIKEHAPQPVDLKPVLEAIKGHPPPFQKPVPVDAPERSQWVLGGSWRHARYLKR